MDMRESTKQRRERLISAAAMLPELVQRHHGQNAQFTIHGKTLAYYVNYPQRDDPVSLTCKAPPASNHGSSHPTQRDSFLGTSAPRAGSDCVLT